MSSNRSECHLYVAKAWRAFDLGAIFRLCDATRVAPAAALPVAVVSDAFDAAAPKLSHSWRAWCSDGDGEAPCPTGSPG